MLQSVYINRVGNRLSFTRSACDLKTVLKLVDLKKVSNRVPKLVYLYGVIKRED